MHLSNPTNSTVQLIDPETDPRWDRFVENHPFGWICHLSGWRRVLEKSFKHMKGYYFALQDSDGHIQAGLPVFHVKSWLTGNRLVSIPFATLADPLISTTEEMDTLFEAVLKLSEELKCPYIQIRTLQSGSFIEGNGFRREGFYKHHFLSLRDEPEKLKKKFHRSCVRQRITRAEKSKVTVREGENEEDLLALYQLHMMTRKRLGLPAQPYAFLKAIWKAFFPTKRMMLLLAETDGKAIGGLILLNFKDRLSAELAAWDETFRDVSPNHLLFWEAIKLAYDEGYKIFDFGRTPPSDKGLMDFKGRWGTKVVDLPQFFYPADMATAEEHREQSLGYRLTSQVVRRAPLFLQGALGNFLYHHLG